MLGTAGLETRMPIKTFPMQHYDRDIFTYETAGENAVGRSGVTFTIGPDGKANQVPVENLDVHGEGTFKRANERKQEPTKVQIPSGRDAIVILSDAKDLWYFFQLPMR